MIKVQVTQRNGQPDCWYINEVENGNVTAGKICYKSGKDAAVVARKQHPYVNIDIQN
ncbi:MAG: hypothetical protein HXX11_15480 [Desulfuromonadales bacterium]|nr:hypothetical protein [Desulfuromonadales bacterium]